MPGRNDIMFSSEGRVGIFYFFTASQVQFAIRPDAAVESFTSPPWIQPGSRATSQKERQIRSSTLPSC